MRFDKGVVKVLTEKYGYSDYYVRQCVAGRRKGSSADLLRRDYDKLCRIIEAEKKKFLDG